MEGGKLIANEAFLDMYSISKYVIRQTIHLSISLTLNEMLMINLRSNIACFSLDVAVNFQKPARNWKKILCGLVILYCTKYKKIPDFLDSLQALVGLT